MDELLAQYGEVRGVWMPMIKTHCWALFATREAAEAAVAGLQGLKFPDSRVDGKVLSAALVSVADAEKVLEAKDDSFLAAGAPGGAPEPGGKGKKKGRGAEEGAAGGAGGEARAAPRLGSVAGGVLAAAVQRAAEDASQGAAGRAITLTREERQRAAEGDEALRERLAQVGAGRGDGGDGPGAEIPPDRGAAGGDGSRPASPSPGPGPTLDELFRKTAAKPPVYWNPRTTEGAAELGKGRGGKYPERTVAVREIPADEIAAFREKEARLTARAGRH